MAVQRPDIGFSEMRQLCAGIDETVHSLIISVSVNTVIAYMYCKEYAMS